MSKRLMSENIRNDRPSTSRGHLMSPSLQNDSNDDTDRMERRGMVLLNSELTNNYINGQTRKSEILAHLETCLKLHAENKISAKNVWKMKIIDYLTEMVEKNTFAKETLRMATSSLELGGKIYAIKVDDVYTQGLQLAVNMATAAAVENDDAADSEGDNADFTPKRKKRKSKPLLMLANIESNLAKDSDSLVCTPNTLSGACFSLSNRVFDNLLTLNVPVNYAKTLFRFADQSPLLVDVNSTPNSIVSEECKHKLKVRCTSSGLCPPFSDLHFLNWNPETLTEDSFNEALDTSIDDNELVFDNKGFPMHEMEKPKEKECIVSSSTKEKDDKDSDLAKLDTDYIKSRQEVDPLEETEYFYRTAAFDSSDKMLNLWAGPSHWHLKIIRANGHILEGEKKSIDKTLASKSNKKPKMQACSLDFPTDSFNSLRKKGKRKNYNLPFDHSVQKEQCEYHVAKSSLITRHTDSAEDPEHRLASPLNVNSDNEALDSQDCDFSNNQCNESNLDVSSSNIAEWNQQSDVDPTDLLSKSMRFPNRAKRIDMQQLKDSLWNTVSATQDSEVNLFTNVYKKVPEALDKSTREVLNAPIAFVALLHLANERNLLLTGHENYDDVTISKGGNYQ